MIIVDATVVFKWFDNRENGYTQARILLEKHLLKHDEIAIPDLLLYEVGNAWSTKSTLNIDKILENINLLEEYLPKQIPINFKLIKKACQFSKRYGVSVYDATYAIIAEEKGCDLITADDKFANKVNLPFVKKLTD